MAGRRSQGDRACCGEQADVSCAGLTVRRLSEERVHELAEEIWRASTGRPAPPHSRVDPRRSRPGASAQAAYLRRRQQDRAAWRPGWRRRTGIAAAATVGCGLLIGLSLDAGLGWRMAVLVALLAGWLLRFRPSARARVWRGQAAMQRRTACALQPLEQENYLVLHDITLPGWPTSIDHLVVGATGIWVIESWRPGRLRIPRTGRSPRPASRATAGVARRLRWQAAALADTLAGDPSIPARPLLCVHLPRWLASRQRSKASRWPPRGNWTTCSAKHRPNRPATLSEPPTGCSRFSARLLEGRQPRRDTP
jgi:hypothetical protein